MLAGTCNPRFVPARGRLVRGTHEDPAARHCGPAPAVPGATLSPAVDWMPPPQTTSHHPAPRCPASGARCVLARTANGGHRVCPRPPKAAGEAPPGWDASLGLLALRHCFCRSVRLSKRPACRSRNVQPTLEVTLRPASRLARPALLQDATGRKAQRPPSEQRSRGTRSSPRGTFTLRLLGWIGHWAGPSPGAWWRFYYGQFIFNCVKIKSPQRRHRKLFTVLQRRKTNFVISIVFKCVIQGHVVQPPPLSVSGHVFFTAQGNPGSLSGRSGPSPAARGSWSLWICPPDAPAGGVRRRGLAAGLLLLRVRVPVRRVSKPPPRG